MKATQMKYLAVTPLLALLLALPGQAVAAGNKSCGKYEYEVFGSPETLKGAKGVEIMEFFNYSCGHCYRFLTTSKKLHKKYKDKLLHKKFPIYWGNQTPYPARAYYISDELGLEEKFTQELFDTNFKLNINIFRPRVINLLAEDYGIQEEMETGMQSKSIQDKVNHSLMMAKKYKANETPTLIVNYVYRLKPSMFEGSVNKLTDCLDLIFEDILGYN